MGSEYGATNYATMRHIERVRNLLNQVIVKLLERAEKPGEHGQGIRLHMTTSIKLWFPDFYTEAHRQKWQGDLLVEALSAENVDCRLAPTGCDICFCGSISRWLKIRKYNNLRTVHFSWDLYPFNIADNGFGWRGYIEELKKCLETWVPSQQSVQRCRQYGVRNVKVIKSSVRPLRYSDGRPVVSTGANYVMDVMRQYKDPMCGMVERTCKHLGIPFKSTKTQAKWDDFCDAVAGARFLASVYDEATTGGLSLLEGYAIGKPVLLTTSPFNGGQDYFGPRASYCNKSNLGTAIHSAWNTTPVFDAKASLDPQLCSAWVEENYSDRAFAKRIVNRLREIL